MNQSGPAVQQCAVGNELYLHAAFITYIHEFIETGMAERLSLDMKINIRSNISYLQDDLTEKGRVHISSRTVLCRAECTVQIAAGGDFNIYTSDRLFHTFFQSLPLTQSFVRSVLLKDTRKLCCASGKRR